MIICIKVMNLINIVYSIVKVFIENLLVCLFSWYPIINIRAL